MDPLIIDIIGYIAGVLIVGCLLPQLYCLIKHKKSRDLSISMFLVMLVAQLLWAVYGILLNDLRIILTNVSSVLITIIMIILCIVYRNN